MSGLEDDFGAVNDIADGAHGLVDDELDADGGGEMKDGIGFGDEARGDLVVFDRALDEAQARVVAHGFKVIETAGGKIVQDGDAIAAREEALGQMRADEACSAGDEDVTRHEEGPL